MEFSRLVVPKPPRTSSENHQKKESTFWKSYKVCVVPVVGIDGTAFVVA